MKHCFFAVLVLFFVQSNAQYKKASFLNKKGRTYEFSGTAHFISDGKATVPGIVYSFGRQHEEKRTFHWFDFEYMLPAKFSYTTEEFTVHTPATVTGKSTAGIAFRYNFAYNLVDNSNKDNKLLPFVTAGIGTALVIPQAENNVYTPGDAYDVKKLPVHTDLNLGLNFGLGLVYNFTPVFGIKLSSGYGFQFNYNGDKESYEGNGYTLYTFYKSHPYANLGVRFSMPQRD